jgi:tetratricopeptide (TPR) repeat protein
MRPHCLLCVPPAVLSLIIGATLSGAEIESALPDASRNEEAARDHARELMGKRRYGEARAEFEVIVRADEQTHGAQDAQTLNDRLELAIAWSKTGNAVKAEDEMRTLLAILMRRRGPNQDETLNCRTALARLLDDAGRPHEAIKEYRQILECREQTLGPDDLEVARVRHALGDALAAENENVEAIAEFRKAGVVFERVLGAEHAETLLNRSNLAMAAGEHQQYEMAEKELQEILAIRERVLGPKDVSVLMTCYSLARVYGGDKRYEEALPYATRAADGLRGAFEPNNVLVLRANRLCAEIRADLALSKAQKEKAAAPESVSAK